MVQKKKKKKGYQSLLNNLSLWSGENTYNHLISSSYLFKILCKRKSAFASSFKKKLKMYKTQVCATEYWGYIKKKMLIFLRLK